MEVGDGFEGRGSGGSGGGHLQKNSPLQSSADGSGGVGDGFESAIPHNAHSTLHATTNLDLGRIDRELWAALIARDIRAGCGKATPLSFRFGELGEKGK
uniref:Uncharacterized protein n=1 Tax=Nelumbo nucifera TaxID=4432 RepID=A0A822YN18_NELNU|nr:TPA_asm: hypothetical protein HUJ06_012773 [Nelumbo nucifera]